MSAFFLIIEKNVSIKNSKIVIYQYRGSSQKFLRLCSYLLLRFIDRKPLAANSWLRAGKSFL